MHRNVDVNTAQFAPTQPGLGGIDVPDRILVGCSSRQCAAADRG